MDQVQPKPPQEDVPSKSGRKRGSRRSGTLDPSGFHADLERERMTRPTGLPPSKPRSPSGVAEEPLTPESLVAIRPESSGTASSIPTTGKNPLSTPSVESILKDLTDPRPRVRLQALTALSVCPDSGLDKFVVGLLGDPSAKVRLEAIRQIGDRRVKEGRGPLLTFLGDVSDLDQAASAVGALSKIGGKKVIARFAEILKDRSSVLHRMVMENLPAPLPGELVEPLLALVAVQSYPWREQALLGLLHAGDPRIASDLAALIDDPDEKVAVLAIRCLAKYPSPASYDRLHAMLTAGEQTSLPVRKAALELVAIQGGAGAMRLLPELLDGPVEIALTYLARLTALDVRGLEDRVARLVLTTNPDLVLAALDYLKATGAAACLPTLEKALESPNWTVRAKVMDVSGRIVVPGAFELIARGLSDANRHVRGRALEALRTHQDDRSETLLIAHLSDDFFENRVLSIRGLALSGSKDVRDHLLPCLKDPHSAVRLAACEVLENYDLTGCLEPFTRLCTDSDPKVREVVGRILKGSMDPSHRASMAQVYYYLECREYERAESILLSLLASDSCDPRVHYELGRLYLRTRRIEPGRSHLEQALELKSDHLGCLKALSRLLLKQRDYPAAERVTKRLLGLMPGNSRALKGLGVVHFHQGRFESARDLFQQVLDSTPEDLEVHELLGRACLSLKLLDQARTELGHVLQEDPFAVRVLSVLGDVEMEAGRHDVAIRHYEAAVRQAPGEIPLLERLAQAEEACGNIIRALEISRDLATRDPGGRSRLLTLARLNLALGDAQKSLKLVDDILSKEPDRIEALALKGEIHEALTQYHQALDTYFKVHALDCKTPALLLKIGRVYQKNGQTEQALKCFREYLKENPKDYETRLLLARADRECGNLAEAVRKLSVCVTQKPQDHRGFLELALVFTANRNLPRALAHARTALDLAPRDMAVLNLVGKLELESAELDSAREHLDRSLAINDQQADVHRLLVTLHAARRDHPRVIFHHHRCGSFPDSFEQYCLEVAQAYVALGHLQKGREWLEKGLALQAESPLLLKQLLELEVVAKDHAKALAVATKLLALTPADTDVARHVGLILLRQGKHEESLSYLRTALEANPSEIEVREALAVALYGTGQFRQVVDLHAQGGGFVPSVSARLLLASAHFRLDQRSSAKQILLDVVEENPSVVDAHHLLARIYHAEDDLVEAEVCLNRAIQLDPGATHLHVERGILFMKRLDYERARHDLIRANRDCPENTHVLRLLARLENEVGHLHQARAYLDTLLSLNSRDADGQYLKGLIFRKLGNFDSALECLENAIELAPVMPEPHLEAGEIYLSKGQVAPARKHFETYLSLKPGAVPALKALANLSQQEGNTYAARYYLEELLKAEANPKETYAAFLEILFASGDTHEAWNLIDRIAAQMPDVIGGLGDRFLEKGQPALARELLRRACSIAPSADLLVSLAASNQLLDRPNIARDTLRKALELDPSHIGANLKLGRLARQYGDLPEAKLALTRVVRLDPDNTEATAELAMVLHSEGEDQEAARIIEKALSSSRRRPSAETYALAGEIFERLVDTPRALDCYMQAVALGEPSGKAHHRAARLHRAAGSIDTSRAIFRELLTLQPGNQEVRSELAQTLMDLGDPLAAAKEWEIVGSALGFTATLLEKLVYAYVSAERWDDATHTNQKLLTLAPHDLAGLLYAGDLATRAKRFVDATAHYQVACEKHASQPSAWAKLAESLVHQGRFQEALSPARKAAELDPTSPNPQLVLGTVYARLCMPEKAKETLEKCLLSGEKPPAQAYVELARIYRKLKSNKEAADLLETLAAREGDHRDCQLELALLHFESKDYTRALEALRRLSAKNPRDSEILEMMGLAYSRVGMSQKAIECQAALLAVSQVSEKLTCELSRQAINSGRQTEALHVLEEGLARAPHSIGLSLELASTHLKMRNYKEAEALLKRILLHSATNHDALVMMGELYEKTREFDLMRETFLKLVRTSPFDAIAHLFLGRASLALSLCREAQEAFRKAIHLDCNLTSAHLGLARSLKEAGDPGAAAEEYNQVLKLDPKSPEALFELATILETMDQRELAQFHLRELTRVVPHESRWAVVARERLEHAQ